MLLVALLIGGVSPASAQEPVTITGTLLAFEPAQDVLIRVTAGVPVTLTLSAPAIDPTLAVLDAVGQVFARNDDYEGNYALPSPRDSALAFTPEADDLLIVRVASQNWAYSGDYTLTLEGAQVMDQTPVTILQNASGSLVEGALEAQDGRAPREAFSFPALAGETVTLRLTSDAFDAMLDVYDFRGALVASNDDHDSDRFDLPARTDAALVFDIPADSLYVAVVRAFEDAGGGRFVLSIEGASFGQASVISADSGPQTGVCDNVLGSVVQASSTFGQAYAAENLLDGDPLTGWSSRADDSAPSLIFEVNSGATVLLDGVAFNSFAASPGFERDSVRGFEVGVATSLVAPEAFQIVLQAEAPQENGLRAYPFEPVAARYVLLRPLTNYGGGYFQATAFNACTTLTGSVSGNLSGEPPFIVSGQLRPNQDYLEYRVYARENASLAVTLVSEIFDPVLEVYAENGRRLADSDDHPPEFRLPRLWDAALALPLPEIGPYTIRVRSFAGGGPFVLTISGENIQAQPPAAPPLAPCRDVSSAGVGGRVVRFSSEFGGRWLADYLNDGSTETGWASAPAARSARPEYVVIDLAGGAHTIGGIRINPAATGGDSSAHNISRFAVLVSDTTPELSAFREVFSTLLAERSRLTLGFSLPEPVTARYVMLETRDTFGGRWHEVAEFTVCAVE
ncbi:MAG: discoidin domain-containing protein [Anaerolineae bacterium]|nr:discoidin domain-containing protein [Anaerolineae bacterium]